MFLVLQINSGVVHLDGLCTVSYICHSLLLYTSSYGMNMAHLNDMCSWFSSTCTTRCLSLWLLWWLYIDTLHSTYTDSLSVLIRSFFVPSEIFNTKILVLVVAIHRRRVVYVSISLSHIAKASNGIHLAVTHCVVSTVWTSIVNVDI